MGFYKIEHSGIVQYKKFPLLSNPPNTPYPRQYLVKNLLNNALGGVVVNRFFLENVRDTEIHKLMV